MKNKPICISEPNQKVYWPNDATYVSLICTSIAATQNTQRKPNESNNMKKERHPCYNTHDVFNTSAINHYIFVSVGNYWHFLPMRIHHAWPSQMHRYLLICMDKTSAIASVQIAPIAVKAKYDGCVWYNDYHQILRNHVLINIIAIATLRWLYIQIFSCRAFFSPHIRHFASLKWYEHGTLKPHTLQIILT